MTMMEDSPQHVRHYYLQRKVKTPEKSNRVDHHQPIITHSFAGGHTEVAEILLQHGAMVNVGKTLTPSLFYLLQVF